MLLKFCRICLLQDTEMKNKANWCGGTKTALIQIVARGKDIELKVSFTFF